MTATKPSANPRRARARIIRLTTGSAAVPGAVVSRDGSLIARAWQLTCGASPAAVIGPPSGPQVGPSFLLAPDDLDDTGGHVADVRVHVGADQFLVAHRVLAGRHLDARLDRVGDARVADRVELQHADAGSVGDDFDLDVGRAEIVLQVLDVVEYQVPARRVGLADLHDDARLRSRALRAHGRCHAGGGTGHGN